MTASSKHPILLVDDESEILFSLQLLLRREFEVYTAEGGAAALEVLRQHPVHVIVSDQRMPQMTGVEFLRRAREARPEAVRIMLTGYADIKAVIDAVNQCRIFHYLTKPCDPDDLRAVLQQACARYDRFAERQGLLGDLRDYLGRCQTLLHGLPDGQAGQTAQAGSALLSRLDGAIQRKGEG